ncbi:MAG: DUF4955 domain-containing protein [Armatimonadota bacterium]|nr:DUF4955 domain-containing protein [Armatimonadota bacterium]
MNIRNVIACLPLLLIIRAVTQGAESSGPYSLLWGKEGERWSATSRLPDFSFAGYHSGEAPLPNPPVKVNVRDFGAKGDGEADDTQAFVRAVEAVQDGAVLVPAGRYKITDILYIRKSNVVLRGEGPDKTVLVFPKALEHLKPKASATTTGQATSGYSWSGGLIWVEGKPTGTSWSNVQTKVARGSNVIELAAPMNVTPGQRVEIEQQDPGDKSLVAHLYGGQSGDVSKIGSARTPFVSRVMVVDGAKLTLERPLRTDVDPHWKARVRLYQPSVTEVGVENLGFEFPNNPYRGHFKEDGYNPLAFSGVADCWARNLRIFNADSGPFLSGSFITLENLVFEANRPANNGDTGHHGVTMGNDNLLRDFDFRTKFIHDISVEGSGGSVVMRGKGVDLCFDHHKRHPHANLFTDIDIGAGTRIYRSGGGANLGRNAGAWTTFWNIRAARPQKWPAANWGPDLMNFVGVESKDAPVLDEKGRWFEPIPPAQLQPPNLYEAQLAHRLKSAPRLAAEPLVQPPASEPTSPRPPAEPLTWAPPALSDATTIEVRDSQPSLKLDRAKDYIVKLPAKPRQGGLTITGGHNVVVIGGEIHVPSKEQDPAFKGATRALYLNQQTGTIHVEGLLISGDGLTEGVNLDQRNGGIVQFENVRIETVHGSFSGHHADLIQTWAGPAELRVDRLTGLTDYQGFFLLPNQHFKDGAAPILFDFRRINIKGSDKSAYLLWTQTKPEFPIKVTDVYLAPNPKKAALRDQFLWPKPSTGDRSWQEVKVGEPPGGDFVPEGVAGINYVSPGYQKP